MADRSLRTSSWSTAGRAYCVAVNQRCSGASVCAHEGGKCRAVGGGAAPREDVHARNITV